MPHEKMKRFAIIVAGGNGQRMNAELPKQFLLLRGKPVIMHCIKKFFDCDAEIIVVLPQAHLNFWEELKLKYNFKIPHKVISGGTTRCESVFNGLGLVDNNDSVIAVHDAVRPLISDIVIIKLFAAAEEKGNAIPVIGVRDSLRKVSGSENGQVNRDDYRIVQTPQVFQTKILKDVFENTQERNFTDEASLVESCGIKINIEKGEQRNIKITFPEDLILAEALLQ
jgi:2-C-methyl-D-erythritol 4-phosphate cytidylyltransferase